MNVRGLAVFTACVAVISGAWPATPNAATADRCAPAIAAMEQAHAIPSQLLRAVALAESGRWDHAHRRSLAWPWTVTAGGQAAYFADRQAAVTEVKRLRAAKVKNIDVGCMQVNLAYHPDAFDDLDAAFEPASNVAYAASFLTRLYGETRSWSRAVAFYHSTTPKLGQAYRNRVFRLWGAERRRAAEEQRLSFIAARKQASAERRAKHGKAEE